MIALGCNYSQPLLELIDEERVTIDWIKLSGDEYYADQFPRVTGIRPILMHFLPRIMVEPTKKEFVRLNKIIAQCGSPYVAIHLMVREEDIDEDISRSKLKGILINNINKYKENLEVDLLIESMPYYNIPDICKYIVDPEFLKELCEEADVDFLLDTGHIKIGAIYRGELFIEDVKKLPLERVREIHVSSPRYIDGKLRDAHQYLLEEDYELISQVLQLTKPQMLTLEYGGDGSYFEHQTDKGLIEKQLHCLQDLINGNDKL